VKVKIWLAMVCVYIFWGGTYLAIRYAVQSLPPFLMAGTRWMIAGLIFFSWMRLSGAPRPTLRQWKTTGVVGLLLLVGGNGLLSWAEQSVVSSVAAVLIGSVPLWIVIVDALRPGGIRPGWQTTAGVLVGFIGILVLVDPFNLAEAETRTDILGVLVLLLAALFWSIGSIYSREHHGDMPDQPLLASGMEMLVGGLGLFAAGTLRGEWGAVNLAAVSPESLLGIAYLVLFGSLVAYASYSWLLGVAPTPLVSTYAYVNPLVAVLLGSLLAQETVDLRILLATFLIVGAVLLTNTTRWRRLSGQRKVRDAGAVSMQSCED
jgi:drug/metabolite transporter (DMT)-like permease